MRDALERALGRPIEAVDARPHRYRTSFALEDVDVRFRDGERLRLVVKHLEATSLSDAAARAKPEFLLDPRRELEVYGRILDGRWRGTATLYGSLAEPADNRYWLLLERVRGVELFQVGEVGTWCEVARRLAAFHQRCRGLDSPALIRYDADYYARWSKRALEFAGTEVTPAVRCYEHAVRRLLALETTVVHGELYASNVLVDRGADGLRICPVDWELAGIGPGLVDLAALTAGWRERERWQIALAYYAAAGGRGPGFERFLDLLTCCHLHLALRWLGWSASWTPPPEHRHDWLDEALRATARLRTSEP